MDEVETSSMRGRSEVMIFMIFDCTDLRIGASEAKVDARLDFEVLLAPAPQKPVKMCEKLCFAIHFLPTEFLLGSENEMLGIV